MYRQFIWDLCLLQVEIDHPKADENWQYWEAAKYYNSTQKGQGTRQHVEFFDKQV